MIFLCPPPPPPKKNKQKQIKIRFLTKLNRLMLGREITVRFEFCIKVYILTFDMSISDFRPLFDIEKISTIRIYTLEN